MGNKVDTLIKDVCFMNAMESYNRKEVGYINGIDGFFARLKVRHFKKLVHHYSNKVKFLLY